MKEGGGGKLVNELSLFINSIRFDPSIQVIWKLGWYVIQINPWKTLS